MEQPDDFTGIVLSRIEAKFCKEIVNTKKRTRTKYSIEIAICFEKKALPEIFTVHIFALLSSDFQYLRGIWSKVAVPGSIEFGERISDRPECL